MEGEDEEKGMWRTRIWGRGEEGETGGGRIGGGEKWEISWTKREVVEGVRKGGSAKKREEMKKVGRKREGKVKAQRNEVRVG